MDTYLKSTGWLVVILLSFSAITISTAQLLQPMFGVLETPIFHELTKTVMGTAFANQTLVFQDMPVAMLAHMIPGILYFILAPLQLWETFRRRHVLRHKIFGLTIGITSLPMIVSGLYFAWKVPLGGSGEIFPTTFYSIIYILFFGVGIKNAINGNITAHGEWMTRCFYIGFGIIMTPLWYMAMVHTTGHEGDPIFSSACWLSLTSNIICAELWINYRRHLKKRSQQSFNAKFA